MSQVIFSKTASTGQQIEVRLKEYLPGVFIAQLFLDGQFVFGEAKPAPLKSPKGDITHWMGRQGKAIGLTTAEAQIIQHAIDEADAAAKETPEGKERRLRRQRESLVTDYQGLMDEADAAFERGMESDGSSAWRAKMAFSGRITDAQIALEKFDAAHPEVLAAIETEKAAAAARFLATD